MATREIYGNVLIQSGLGGTHASRFIDLTHEGATAINWKTYNNTIVGDLFICNGTGNVASSNRFAHHAGY